MSDNKSAWNDWLDTGQCIQVLQRCVSSMRKILSEDKAFDYTSAENDLQELTAEFWVYLKTRSGHLDRELSRFILHKQWDKLKRKLSSMFRYYLMEKRRDPYYRHVRQVLYECPDLTFIKPVYKYFCHLLQPVASITDSLQLVP